MWPPSLLLSISRDAILTALPLERALGYDAENDVTGRHSQWRPLVTQLPIRSLFRLDICSFHYKNYKKHFLAAVKFIMFGVALNGARVA